MLRAGDEGSRGRRFAATVTMLAVLAAVAFLVLGDDRRPAERASVLPVGPGETVASHAEDLGPPPPAREVVPQRTSAQRETAPSENVRAAALPRPSTRTDTSAAWAYPTSTDVGIVYAGHVMPAPKRTVALRLGGSRETLLGSDGGFRFERVPAGTYLVEVVQGDWRQRRVLLQQEVQILESREDEVLRPAATARLELQILGAAQEKRRFEASVRARDLPDAVALGLPATAADRWTIELPLGEYALTVEELRAAGGGDDDVVPFARVAVPLDADGELVVLSGERARGWARLHLDPADCPVENGEVYVESASGARGPTIEVSAFVHQGAVWFDAAARGTEELALDDRIALEGPGGPGLERLVVTLPGYERFETSFEFADDVVVDVPLVRAPGLRVRCDLPTGEEGEDMRWLVHHRAYGSSDAWKPLFAHGEVNEHVELHAGHLDPGTYELLVATERHIRRVIGPIEVPASRTRATRTLKLQDQLEAGFAATVHVLVDDRALSLGSLRIEEVDPPSDAPADLWPKTRHLSYMREVRFDGLAAGRYRLRFAGHASPLLATFEVVDEHVVLEVRVPDATSR